MNSAKETSFRNSNEEGVSSSESEDDDSSSSSSSGSSSDSSSSRLSSSPDNSEDEAEIPTVSLPLPTSQASQSTQPTSESDTTTHATKTSDRSKTDSASKTRSEQTMKASSETKNVSSTGGVSTEARPASKIPVAAKAKSPEPVKQDDKKVKQSSASCEADNLVLKAKSSTNTDRLEIVKSSTRNSGESSTEVKKTEPKSEQIQKSSKLPKAAADRCGEEEQIVRAVETTAKPKKTAGKPSVAEDGKPVETPEKIAKSKLASSSEKAASVDTEKEENQRETSEKITITKTRKAADAESPADEEMKKEASEKASEPKTKKSVDKPSVDNETEGQRENETTEKTKKSTSSKRKQSLEKSPDVDANEEDKPKEASEKIPKSSKSSMSSENTDAVDIENQKESTKESLTSFKQKKKLSTQKISDAESEKAVKTSEETSEKSETSSFSKNIKSQEKISDDKDAEVENLKDASEKRPKLKKPKSSSEGQVADEKREATLTTKLNESEAKEVTSELVPKEPVKKRKKSPAKQTEEVSEKEGEASEKNINVVADETRSAETLEKDSTKLSIDETGKNTLAKPKKTLKRSSKSPTPAKDEIIEKSGNEESEITTSGKESYVLVKAIDTHTKADTDTSDKIEIVSLNGSCQKVPATEKMKDGLKTENASVTQETEANRPDSRAGNEDAKEEKSSTIADDAVSARPSLIVSEIKEDAVTETKATESQPRSAAQGVERDLGNEVKASEASQGEMYDEGIATGLSVSEDALGVRVESATAAEDDTELDFGLKRESVDDFIQRILSEVRESDKRVKQLARGRLTDSPTERANNEGDEPEQSQLKGLVTEANRVGGEISASNTLIALEETTTGGGGIGGGGRGERNGETRQRSRFVDEEDEELAAAEGQASNKHLTAARKIRLQQMDYDDLDADDLEKRAREAAAEITRRRKLDQDMEMEADNYPPYTKTMYGPRVSRRNLQRYNLGDSEFEGREESFLSKFRRERGGGGGYLPDDEFAPRRREETGEIMRQKTRGVRSLVDQQTEVIDAVKKASKGLDELDKEILGVKQLSLGHRAHVEALESAFDSEARAYENEYQAATEGQRQRKAQQTQERKENILSLMFGPRPTTSVEPTQDVFSILANTSTPAVASFMNIYGSGAAAASKGSDGIQVNGVLDERPSRDFGISADLRSGSKVNESAYFASERRNETGSRRETGRMPDVSSSLSGWSPTVSGINVDTSASDEFLSRVRSKNPFTSFSPNVGESSGGSASRYADASSGLLGAPSDAQWISRFTRAAVEPASRSGSGYSSPSYFPSDTSTFWRERGISSRRPVNLSDGGAGGGEPRGRRSGPDVYFGKSSISSSTGTRTRRS